MCDSGEALGSTLLEYEQVEIAHGLNYSANSNVDPDLPSKALDQMMRRGRASFEILGTIE